ncbi:MULTISPECIES: glycine--tRNA ligase subunit beta [Aerococcus]|uniref:Glycine--tRNA ligase beta subunit n=1 Tax=Aerococcus sanguinicola TaxID=119206 RepID=A0A5N1GNF7_9LACT|nr:MULTISPECIES: glycine--tRNA ligase subunit beta [Aerococcus]KAA9301856.1 glycine--tRNA ligase subunit beta [Aerococcus sanguinicola]MDK6368722.1 glycine--tRNA ligase subunit beta [Aerococcus sp. UMB9870]MDK6685888.1 glycine--tRNA ligase subunit beta [Aerococcus sp. UMB8623]MDK6939345.1 glycine--tRNA ligase subunit beta [Aerococcus sp. UMB8487]OFK19389.1 glycine--tRNA ligase subunit beta [Aerococcus sp. HMSC072A12]
MSKQQYLLEVGLEEMPAKYVRQISQQFQDRVASFLTDHRLTYDAIKAFATPRRFAVLVDGLADQQTDFVETAKGPSEKIAKDDQGEWTKAAQGFARGKGLSTDDLYVEDGYIYAEIKEAGKPSQEILPQISQCITQMTFPVSMYWSTHQNFKYIRPIHWFLSLLDDQVLPFELLGIQADRYTRGHRFLGHDQLAIDKASNYEKLLERDYVIADQDKRKEVIVQQIKDLAEAEGVQVSQDEALLEEVTQIVEYPTAFIGSFDDKYLALPDPVLITSMAEHQRYFYVSDHEGNLLPKFVAVRNGNEEGLENVRHGNEKVLVARLEDGLFFVEEDKKQSIDDFAKRLSHVTFHAEIGSMKEKMNRVKQIAKFLYNHWTMENLFADYLSSDFEPLIERTGDIYKFDLETNIVNEFSELQGIMGEYYAREAGEAEEVAVAIREHYMPIASDAALGQSALGILFAIADKLDTIISFFKIDRIPSGSNDPFALRRQMIGIVRLLAAEELPFDWGEDLEAILEAVYPSEAGQADLADQVYAFMLERLKNVLESEGYTRDISQAVLGSSCQDINQKLAAAKVLADHHSDEDFKSIIESWNRILNLKGKMEEFDIDQVSLSADLLETPSEEALYQAVDSLHLGDTPADYYQALAELAPLIEQFFEDNMVFTDDEAVRNNRLVLLAKIGQPVKVLANTKELLIK